MTDATLFLYIGLGLLVLWYLSGTTSPPADVVTDFPVDVGPLDQAAAPQPPVVTQPPPTDVTPPPPPDQAPQPPVGSPSGIPLDQVQVLNTSENVLAFPETAQISELRFEPGNLHLVHSKQGVWPPLAFGAAQQEGTLWIAAFINGSWFAAGMERLRPNQQDKPEGQDPHNWIADWVQGRDFGPFNNLAIPTGTPIGVFVVAGNSRLASEFAVRERTNVQMIDFP